MIQLDLPAWLPDFSRDAPQCPDAESRVRYAINLAAENVRRRTGGPFGAAVFAADGSLVAAAVNRVVPENCSLAHAETMAFMLAQQRLGRPRLNADGSRYTLATSAQPCCQCFGASVWAGIDELLIGARAADVEELTGFDEGPLPPDWVDALTRRGIRVERDLLRDAARAVLAEYATGDGALY